MYKVYVYSFFVIVVVSIFSCTKLQADTIFLKSGGKVKGVITKEDSLKVYIDIGIGKSEVEKERIERIQKSNSEEMSDLQAKWRRKYFDTERFIPKRFQKASERMKKLHSIRSSALEIKDRIAGLKLKKKKLVKRIKKLREIYIEANELLKKIDFRTDRNSYNEMINRISAYRADINITKTKLAQIERILKVQNPYLFEYIEKLEKFDSYFNNFIRRCKKKRKLSDNEKIYIKSVKKTIVSFSDDFLKNYLNVAFTPGKHVILNVKINDKKTGRFLLDTGASSVTFSKEFASKLDIDLDKARNITSTMADGSSVSAKAIVLESVQVQDIKEKDILAVVLDKAPGKNIDGLLGMSFLGRFILKIDADNNRIILKKLK